MDSCQYLSFILELRAANWIIETIKVFSVVVSNIPMDVSQNTSLTR